MASEKMKAAIAALKTLSDEYPDNVFLKTGKTELTFGRTLQIISSYRNYLKSFPLSSYVPLISRNHPEAVFLIFALQSLGLIPVLMNLRWSKIQIGHVLEKTKAGVIFYRDGELSTDLIKGYDWIEFPSVEDFTPDKNFDSYNPISSAVMLFTSGITGIPKGVILGCNNLFAGAEASNSNLPFGPNDCWGLCLPLYHVGGLSILYRALLTGGSVYLWNGFNPEEIFESISSSGVTHLSLVPTMLKKLIDHSQESGTLRNLKVILLGGAPAPRALIDECLSRKIPIALTYGLTEAASQVATLTPESLSEYYFTSGKPLKGIELKIVNKSGKEVGRGITGEIAIRGKALFRGYLGERKRNPGKWFFTGDLGQITEDGYLIVRGRRDDMIISGGENIYPAEIENVAKNFPAVRDAVVTGIPHPEWGTRPVMVVEPEPGGNFNLRDFQEFLRRELSKIQMPSDIFISEKIPRISISKTDRKAVQEWVRQKMKLETGTTQ